MSLLFKHASLTMTVLVSTCLLAGCSLIGQDRVAKAEAEMAAIRAAKVPGIQPPPQQQPIQEFVYDAQDTRDPFLAPSLIEKQKQAANNPGIVPDTNRPTQPLENFELSQLTYRGSLTAPNGKLYGMVQQPDGLIRNVQVGNYMGKNFGRVVEITPTQINLIEIVPDSRSGYIEKPESLVSPGN